MTEREKMLCGLPYLPADPDLDRARSRTRSRLRLLATCDEADDAYRTTLRELLPHTADDFTLVLPFHCDYGEGIYAGPGCFVNAGCVFLDGAPIRLGERVFVGPGVQLLTAEHPLDAALRSAGTETARGIEIGDDCWLGGGAIVCPGVRIGAHTVVGAGAVVTRDLPSDCVAAGNPARILRNAGR